MKILSVIGTRPESIKMAPLIHEMMRRPSWCIPSVCVTAQHRSMIDEPLKLFGIKSDYDLDLMSPDQTLSQLTSRALDGLDMVLKNDKPDIVMVQGDTTTTLCGALSAFYHKIKVGHVEAGLRTRYKYSPFPEEINRRIVSSIADYNFAPTDTARQALLSDGIPNSSIFVTGNTGIDAMLWAKSKLNDQTPIIPNGLKDKIDGKITILITCHRRESFGEDIENICKAILDISNTFPEVVFVYPVHPNPNVREPVYGILGGHKQIHLIDPQPYLTFVWLMDHASIIMTDSGGVQEESSALGKPVVIMRNVTDRPDGISCGTARLSGVSRMGIIEEVTHLLRNPESIEVSRDTHNPYGDGHASEKIVDILLNT